MTRRAPVALSLSIGRGLRAVNGIRGCAPSSAGGGAPLPPPADARLALIVPPSALARLFHYSCCGGGRAVIARAWFIVLGLVVLFGSVRSCRVYSRLSLPLPLPFSGSFSRSVPLAPFGTPPIGGSRYARHSGCRYAPFLSACALTCGLCLHGFPIVSSLPMFAPCIHTPTARWSHSFWRGLMPPAPPSLFH